MTSGAILDFDNPNVGIELNLAGEARLDVCVGCEDCGQDWKSVV